MSDPITCGSRISRVVVYARGAVVTRRVELPVGLPAEACAIHVDGVTPMAEPGSVRTEVDGERRITGVQAPLVYPQADKPLDLDQQAIKRKQREVRRNQQRRDRVRYRMQLVEGIHLQSDLSAPEPEEGNPQVGIIDRVGSSLAASDLVNELLTRLDAEFRKLEAEAAKLAAELQQLYARPVAHRSNEPHRRIVITLGPGNEHLRSLEFSYNVNAARWWPAYSARLTNGGKNAEFAVEAFVAQNTLEDWVDAQVSLCTADMISDLTLPELQSLRLGRSQPPKSTGFREPPEGLDAMFANYDAQFGQSYAPPTTVVSSYDMARTVDTGVLAARPQPMPEVRMQAPASPPMGAAASMSYKADAPADELYDDGIGIDEMAKDKVGRARSAPAKSAKKEMQRRDAEGEMAEEDLAFGGGGKGAPAEAAPEPEPDAPGVSDTWLDFDALELAQNGTHRRGRLGAAAAPYFSRASELRSAIEYLGAPAMAQDPLYSRGLFDHRYDADGIVEIPSATTPQRVRLMAKPAKSRMTFRCVPLEDERVFREVEIENPLEAPLIGGPVDVFMDGALLITSAIGATDRGGVIRFGLGEEQRVRVARNVRAKEESKGMFKGGTAMEHTVLIEAASSLAGDIELEIVDRLPVTDDKDIKVELIASSPRAPEKYNQQERGSHVRGGLLWKLALKAGSTAQISFDYRIGFDKDHELIGGNRRA
jgi:hypothetical protein